MKLFSEFIFFATAISCICGLDPDENDIIPNCVTELVGAKKMKVFYQTGTSDLDLPECSLNQVCNKIDTYSSPWAEKQCRCPGGECALDTIRDDGYTVVDRHKLYKLCHPARKLPMCRYFKDVTWTYLIKGDANMSLDNVTHQTVHCRCPKNSVPFLVDQKLVMTDDNHGEPKFKLSFACSPQAKIPCQYNSPCRLFTINKLLHRPAAEEVNTSTLCQCEWDKKCPTHHAAPAVVKDSEYKVHDVVTYSGYCKWDMLS